GLGGVQLNGLGHLVFGDGADLDHLVREVDDARDRRPLWAEEIFRASAVRVLGREGALLLEGLDRPDLEGIGDRAARLDDEGRGRAGSGREANTFKLPDRQVADDAGHQRRGGRDGRWRGGCGWG